MNAAAFEQLVSALAGLRPRVASAACLLEAAASVLDADCAALLSPATGFSRIRSWPPSGEALLAQEEEAIRVWLRSLRPVSVQGYVTDQEDGSLVERLAAFGNRSGRPTHDLILFLARSRRRDDRWTSYETWAAAFLLSEHQLLTAQHAMGALEQRIGRMSVELEQAEQRQRRLARVVRSRVVRNQSWPEFLLGIESLRSTDPEWYRGFACENAAIWTTYRLREMPAPGRPPDWPASTALPGSTAWEWAEKQSGAGNEARRWLNVTLGLAESGGLIAPRAKSPGASRAIPRGRSAHARGSAASGGQPQEEDGPLNLRALAGALEEAPKLIATASAADCLRAREQVALVLEHAWRRIRDNALDPALENEELLSVAATTLTATSALAASLLSDAGAADPPAALLSEGAATSPVDSCPQPERAAGDGVPLGRDELRLYLLLLLARSSRLRERYLGGGDVAGVAEQVQRRFVQSLARFALSLVSRIEEGFGIDVTPPLVSAAEALDSLLHLVDRYVHVELGVDESLDVRRLLSRGLKAEIEHHLARRHYRDHLVHVVDVFLLGHLLLDTELCWLGGRTEPLEAHLCRLVAAAGETFHWHREWAVAALLHDIGYQAFPADEQRRLGGTFFVLEGGRPPDWLVGPPAHASDGGGSGEVRRFVEELQGSLRRHADAASWLPSDAAATPTDHGILSALRVAQLLVHAATAGAPSAEPPDPSRVKPYRAALHAISHHNRFNHPVHMRSHPLSALLRLCDELQEWGRRRVDIEQAVKELYLSIEGEISEGIPSHESLASLGASIGFEATDDRLSVRPILLRGTSQPAGGPPRLRFDLRYRDPAAASFDPVRTLLSKSYNLQHVGLGRETSGDGGPRMEIVLRFPSPREYGHLREHDFYGLHAEETGRLPVLPTCGDASTARPGLCHIACSSEGSGDAFAVIVEAEPGRSRCGWLDLPPDDLLNGFDELKRRVLRTGSGRR